MAEAAVRTFVEKMICILDICIQFSQGWGTEMNQLQSQTNSLDIYSKMRISIVATQH